MNPNAVLFHTVVMILHFLVIIVFRKKVCGAWTYTYKFMAWNASAGWSLKHLDCRLLHATLLQACGDRNPPLWPLIGLLNGIHQCLRFQKGGKNGGPWSLSCHSLLRHWFSWEVWCREAEGPFSVVGNKQVSCPGDSGSLERFWGGMKWWSRDWRQDEGHTLPDCSNRCAGRGWGCHLLIFSQDRDYIKKNLTQVQMG